MKKLKTWWRSEGWRWLGAAIIVFLMYKFVEKQVLIHVVNQCLPPEEAGIMGGIVWGDKSGFEKGFYENLKNSGLVHLVIVSGSNVMLLVGGLIEMSAKLLGRKKSIIVGLLVGWRYTQLVGWEVPVLRAMILVSVFYLAQLYGRKYNLWRALGLAVVMMVAGEVEVLESVSFWLSVTAFLGVVLAPKRISTNLSVALWITPVLGMVFGKISLVSPLSNFLVTGLVEVVTIIGLWGSLTGLIFEAAGRLVLWTAYPALRYLKEVANWTGSQWWGTVAIEFNWWLLAGWYAMLVYFLWKEKTSNE